MTQQKRTVIQDAIEDGWKIVGVVSMTTGGMMMSRNAAVVLKDNTGHLRRIDVAPDSIPEYESDL